MSPILGIWASQISGRLWEPAGAYDALATVTLTSAAPVIFTGIPNTYKHLQIRAVTPIAAWVNLLVNGDTSTTSYSTHEIRGTGSGSATAGGNGNGDALVALGSATTNPTTFITDELDYASTNKHKTFRTLYGSDQNGSGNIGFTSSAYYGNTNPINSLGFYLYRGGNLAVGTTISLYGVK